jgi:hypothetical protein
MIKKKKMTHGGRGRKRAPKVSRIIWMAPKYKNPYNETPVYTWGFHYQKFVRITWSIWRCSKFNFPDKRQSDSVSPTFLRDTDFTDVVLLCQGEEIHCHRVFMAAKSDVFKKMFLQKNFLEGKKLLKHFNPAKLRWLYFYKIRILVNSAQS